MYVKIKYSLLLVCFIFTVFHSYSQIKAIDGSSLNEVKFVAQNKLLNQFIKRFNGEETPNGMAIYPTDKDFRSKRIRKRSFDMLFDYTIRDKVKVDNFSKLKERVFRGEDSFFMALNKQEIISELKVEVYYKSKIHDMTLFFKLQKEKVGSKWVIFKVDFPEYDREFDFDHEQDKFFLHPLSHEIGFINLIKKTKQKEYIELLVDNSVTKVDHLSLFLSHIKSGSLEIYSTGELVYHIFQVPGFYMNVKYINRSNQNAGWLIQDIVKANENEKETLKDFILN